MHTLNQTHEYDASPETVFAYLTETDKLDAWWTTSSVSEPGKGGRYEYRFDVTDEAKADGKEDHVQKGTYTVFEPGKALAYPWDVGTESRVRFDFVENGNGTTLKLVHSDIPDNEELIGMLDGGWQFFLSNLKSVLAGGEDRRAVMGLAIA